MQASRPLRDFLERGLSDLGLATDAVSIDRWVELALLLERWSQRINLTGHRGALAIAQHLLLESAALSQVLPSAEAITDLGSGAGIPGLPLAISRPECEIRLIEARARRHHFQRAAIRELHLQNAVAIHGRAEELPVRPTRGVVSQAFARPEVALAAMRPWVAESGWIAIATSRDALAGSNLDLPRGELRPYSAPGGPARVVWVVWGAVLPS